MSSSDGIIDLYERNAHNYVADRRGVAWDESPWLDRLIGLLPKDATILDIGCGSGERAPKAAPDIPKSKTSDGT